MYHTPHRIVVGHNVYNSTSFWKRISSEGYKKERENKEEDSWRAWFSMKDWIRKIAREQNRQPGCYLYFKTTICIAIKTESLAWKK